MRYCLALALCFFWVLTGCQSTPPRSWHVDARKDGDKVQLCLSNEATCPQPGGVSLSSVSVYRYDSTKDNQLVWDVSPVSESEERIDGQITYGVPPPRWHNRMTPPPVVCGKAYLVNPGAVYFGLKCDGTVVVFDSPQLDEFFTKEAEAAKKPGGH